MGAFLSQSFRIPNAALTEQSCPDQSGRVFIVTGGYTGIGYELSRILYALNATVYLAGRSQEKANKALARIRDAHTKSSGRVEFMRLDLADLETIKPAVDRFLEREERLDVLVNNAGVMFPAAGSTTAQQHELQVGTNCLGPYLLSTLLEPLLVRTAQSANPGSVRVAWAASVGVDVLAPKPGGMKLTSEGAPQDLGVETNYAQTKVGNILLAAEFGRKTLESGVVHVAFNPGNLKTELQRHWTGVGELMTEWLLLYPAINGAHTELWAGLAPEVAEEASRKNQVVCVWPWGRLGTVRADVLAATKPEEEDGTGLGARFVAWCASQTQQFAGQVSTDE
ncbi:MAG: hypothetical protein Q9162_006020 [Coniocarpon cinnabarinum]